jgi:protein-tyrosine phosphatase
MTTHLNTHTQNRAAYRLCFVCSGNICRSPIAEAVLRRLAVQEGLAEVVVVDSAGTGDWHVGEQADTRALRVLSDAGYDAAGHRARQFDPGWFGERDLVIALDRGHARLLRARAPDDEARGRVHLLRSFDPEAISGDLDVPDPYYAGEAAFREVLDQIEAACRGLLRHVRTELDRRTPA